MPEPPDAADVAADVAAESVHDCGYGLAAQEQVCLATSPAAAHLPPLPNRAA